MENLEQIINKIKQAPPVPKEEELTIEEEELPQLVDYVNTQQHTQFDANGNPLFQRGGDLNTKNLRILLDTDEIPERVREPLWALCNRHLQLTVIDKYGLANAELEIRDILRSAEMCERTRHLDGLDIAQVEFFAKRILLPKALDRGERTLISTQISRNVVEGNATKDDKKESSEKKSALDGLKKLLGL